MLVVVATHVGQRRTARDERVNVIESSRQLFETADAEPENHTTVLASHRPERQKSSRFRFFGYSISGFKRVHAVVSPPVQMNTDFSTTARALFFSRALSIKQTPTLMCQRLLPLEPAAYGSREECDCSETSQTRSPALDW